VLNDEEPEVHGFAALTRTTECARLHTGFGGKKDETLT
jgi:hypothetical protein